MSYFKITIDYIWREGDSWESAVGTSHGTRERAEEAGRSIEPIRLLDDDRIPYFVGEAADDDASLIAALNWSANVGGCTILQEQVGGKWQDWIS